MGGTCLKRRTKALLLGLAVPVLLVAGLAWQQRDNLKALGDALRFTPEELEQQMAENQQRIRDAVDAAPDVAVRDVTEEERQALRDGSLSQAWAGEAWERYRRHLAAARQRTGHLAQRLNELSGQLQTVSGIYREGESKARAAQDGLPVEGIFNV